MSKIDQLVRTKGYKNFMAKLYGWGAAVVIMGAQASKPIRADSYWAVPSASQSGCSVNGIIVDRKSVV